MAEELKDYYEGKPLDLSGREYVFEKLPFAKGRRVLAYLGDRRHDVFSILDDEKFLNVIQPIILDYITHNGMQLSKLPQHFDKFTADYMAVLGMAFNVFPYPFMPDVS